MAIKTTTNGPNQNIPGGIGATGNTSRDMRELGPRASEGNGPRFSADEPRTMWMNANTLQTSGPNAWKGNNSRRVKRPDGSIGLEKLPSVWDVSASAGRFRMVVDHHGHLVANCLSNGASHCVEVEHGRFSRNEYAQHQLTKGFFFGWIDVNGGCLVRQVRDGLVNPRRLLVDISKAKMCPKDSASCKHVQAETEKRQARTAEAHARFETNHKSKEQRRDEEQSTILTAIQQLLEKGAK